MAAVLGTGIDAIALTHSTTEGMNLAVGALGWRPGDRLHRRDPPAGAIAERRRPGAC